VLSSVVSNLSFTARGPILKPQNSAWATRKVITVKAVLFINKILRKVLSDKSISINPMNNIDTKLRT